MGAFKERFLGKGKGAMGGPENPEHFMDGERRLNVTKSVRALILLKFFELKPAYQNGGGYDAEHNEDSHGPVDD